MSAEGGDNIKVAILCSAVSAAASWYFTKKYLERVYDDRLVLQIEETRAFYLDLYQGGDASEEIEEKAPSVVQAVEAIKKYNADDFVPTDYTKFSKRNVDQEVVKIPVVASTPQAETAEEPSLPDVKRGSIGPRAPYMIDEEEFNNTEVGYPQVSLAYYEEDRVLTNDEDGTLFTDYDDSVGNDNIKFLHDKDATDPTDDHPHTIYVRSESFQTDFEITRMMGKYYTDKLLPPSSSNP